MTGRLEHVDALADLISGRAALPPDVIPAPAAQPDRQDGCASRRTGHITSIVDYAHAGRYQYSWSRVRPARDTTHDAKWSRPAVKKMTKEVSDVTPAA
jgi:hypothetical protein